MSGVDSVDLSGGRDLRDELVQLMHRYGMASQQLGAYFAQKHGLHPTDLQALIAVFQAERAGDPLTPGRLGEAVGLSSGAATAAIDRLERGGHLRRTRESPDRRVVHLRYGEAGMAVAVGFFGPLGTRSHAVMERFSPRELTVVRRFLLAMTEVLADHHEEMRKT
jgi:DNA-binding MarR family transcriptional regulator